MILLLFETKKTNKKKPRWRLGYCTVRFTYVSTLTQAPVQQIKSATFTERKWVLLV